MEFLLNNFGLTFSVIFNAVMMLSFILSIEDFEKRNEHEKNACWIIALLIFMVATIGYYNIILALAIIFIAANGTIEISRGAFNRAFIGVVVGFIFSGHSYFEMIGFAGFCLFAYFWFLVTHHESDQKLSNKEDEVEE